MLTHLSVSNLQAVLKASEEPDSSLGGAIKEALGVIQTILEEDGEEAVAISFNGGKDCTVLLHLLAVCLWNRRTVKEDEPERQGPESVSATITSEINGNLSQNSSLNTRFKALYITCSAPFSEVDAFVEHCASSYSLELFQTRPGGLPMKEALMQYKEHDPSVKSVLLGTRRGDPHGEKLGFRTMTDEGWPQYLRVHPIINWSYEQIWEYLRKFNVPYCDLYNQGYTSLGSTFNTFRNPALRDANGQYKPAYELKDGSQERMGRSKRVPVTPAL
ncbi:adenine nucleotide alpha hydrolases-like protein [Serendipita vermifera]|nr:adenine nucleotide alpha hydrolases-like protein [Serendipita vermifera]